MECMQLSANGREAQEKKREQCQRGACDVFTISDKRTSDERAIADKATTIRSGAERSERGITAYSGWLDAVACLDLSASVWMRERGNSAG